MGENRLGKDSRGVRLDAALVARGLTKSRTEAKQRITAREVTQNGKIADKASAIVLPSDRLECIGDAPRYVSRGGLKLEKALALGGYNLDGKCAMDVGASTGGFTDCLLQHGIKKVYAVDVGHGQLDKRLIGDSRVLNLEGTDIRDTDSLMKYVSPLSVDFCAVDASFISVTLVFDAILQFLKPGADIVCLIKPQFEAGREAVGKNGLVMDPKVHCRILSELCEYFCEKGCGVRGLTYSPVRGKAGNIEYLALLKEGGQNIAMDVSDVVAEAHGALKG